MTVVSLQADSAPANPTQSEILYRAWRYAKATWELADNDPANPEGLSDDERDKLIDIEHDALIAYYLEPAHEPMEVWRKFRTFKDDEAWQYTRAHDIIAQLADDIHALALGATNPNFRKWG